MTNLFESRGSGNMMKALTLTQPWATLVAIGAKCIETRSWRTSYRGPLAIHAAKGFPKAAWNLCLGQPFKSALWPDYDEPGVRKSLIDALPRNPTGKLLKAVLREPYWQAMQRRIA